MTASTRSLVAWVTLASLFTTRETVLRLTPAISATSCMVGRNLFPSVCRGSKEVRGRLVPSCLASCFSDRENSVCSLLTANPPDPLFIYKYNLKFLLQPLDNDVICMVQ